MTIIEKHGYYRFNARGKSQETVVFCYFSLIMSTLTELLSFLDNIKRYTVKYIKYFNKKIYNEKGEPSLFYGLFIYLEIMPCRCGELNRVKQIRKGKYTFKCQF